MNRNIMRSIRTATLAALSFAVLSASVTPAVAASAPSARTALLKLLAVDRDVTFRLQAPGELPVAYEIVNPSTIRTSSAESTDIVAGGRVFELLNGTERARAAKAGYPSLRWRVSPAIASYRAPRAGAVFSDLRILAEYGTFARVTAGADASFDLSDLPEEKRFTYFPVLSATYRMTFDSRGRIVSMVGTRVLGGSGEVPRAVSFTVKYGKPLIKIPTRSAILDAALVEKFPLADLILEAAHETARAATIHAAYTGSPVTIDDLEAAARPLFAPAGLLAFYAETGLKYTDGTVAWCIDTSPAGVEVRVRSCEP